MTPSNQTTATTAGIAAALATAALAIAHAFGAQLTPGESSAIVAFVVLIGTIFLPKV
jgi:hypothetical protein